MDRYTQAMRVARRKSRPVHVQTRRPDRRVSWCELVRHVLATWCQEVKASKFAVNVAMAVADAMSSFGTSALTTADMQKLEGLSLKDLRRAVPNTNVGHILNVLLGWLSAGSDNMVTRAIDLFARSRGSSPALCNMMVWELMEMLATTAVVFDHSKRVRSHFAAIAKIVASVPMLAPHCAGARVAQRLSREWPGKQEYRRMLSSLRRPVHGGMRPRHLWKPLSMCFRALPDNPTEEAVRVVRTAVSPLKAMETILALCHDAGQRSQLPDFIRTRGVREYVCRAVRAMGTWDHGEWSVERLARRPDELRAKRKQIEEDILDTLRVTSTDPRPLQMTFDELQAALGGVHDKRRREMVVVSLVGNYILGVADGRRALA